MVRRTKRVTPSAHLNMQSKIVDAEKNIRGPPEDIPCTPPSDVLTAFDLFSYSWKDKKNLPCFGMRPNFDSEATWINYDEVSETIQAFGRFLVHLHKTWSLNNKFVGICGRNSPEWVYTQQACGYCGFVAVPLYDTFGDEALKHIIHQTKMCILVCDTPTRARYFLNRIEDFVVHLVVMGGDSVEFNQLKNEYKGSVQLHVFNDLVALGKTNSQKIEKTKPDDLYLICYTSGTSGLSKGATFTHRCYVNAIWRTCIVVEKMNLSKIQHMHLSFLPLAHIMEQFMMAMALMRGFQVAFLTTTMSDLLTDIAYYGPTLLVVVPRLVSRLHQTVMQAVKDKRLLSRLLHYAIHRKLKEQAKGEFRQGDLWDLVFFNKIRSRFGGRVEYVFCGSAPLTTEVLHFSKAVFSCPFVEGYGSTETGGAVTITLPTDLTSGHVGTIIPGEKIKLINVPSMDLDVNRDGFGEICVFSNSLTGGYFEDEASTKELFDEDGFVRTGDIGCWTEHGCLRVIDRRKSIFKLSQGEYVAPDKVEAIYHESPLVVNVLVDGRSTSSFAIAIVVPDIQEVWKQFGSRLSDLFGLSKDVSDDATDVPIAKEDLCQSVKLGEMILDELKHIGEIRGLKGFEQAKAIYLSPEPFTIDNGLLTPTMKIARHTVRKHFSRIIDELCAQALL